MAAVAYALTAAAVALAGVVAAELTLTGSDPGQAMAVEAPQPLLPTLTPPPEHNEQKEAWALTALARPLFDPGRRPEASLTAEASTPPPNSLPRLTGTLVSPNGKRAVFATGDKSTAINEGSRFDAWTVQEISAGAVTLSGPDGPRILRVSFATGDVAHKVRTVEPPFSLRPVRTHRRTGVVASK